MRPSRKWFIWGTVVVVFGFFGAIVFAAYMERFGGNSDPILVRAPAEPLKRAPDDPGGLEVANESSNVIAALGDNEGPPQPERILPRDLPSLVDDLPPDAGLPEAELPPEEAATDPDTIDVEPATTQPDLPPVDAEDVAVEDVPPNVPQPAPVRPEPSIAEPPVEVAETPPPTPRQTEPAQPEPVSEPEPVTQPQQTAAVTPAPEPSPAATQSPAPDSSIGFRLQLGAFGSDIAARLAWAAYRERFGEVIADLSPHIARSSGAEPVFRLQAGPFPNRDTASTVCASVKERGGDCFVVAAN
ncbi:MAG: SPOR domain-containing protein [Pseudomonadota bacterium]